MTDLPINDCPFCGSGHVVMNASTSSSIWVQCDDCWATGPDSDEAHKAIAMWNVPVDDHDNILSDFHDLRADNDRLRRELDDCLGIVR